MKQEDQLKMQSLFNRAKLIIIFKHMGLINIYRLGLNLIIQGYKDM